MARSNVTQRLELAVSAATERHRELARRSISPHTIRHTTAMHLLQSGVDIAVIACGWAMRARHDAHVPSGGSRHERARAQPTAADNGRPAGIGRRTS